MEEKHRDIIRRYESQLVEHVNIDKLLPKLVKQGVFSERLSQKFYAQNLNDFDRKKMLFENIPRRGPEAFEGLVRCLREVDDDHANIADKLLQFMPVNESLLNTKPFRAAIYEDTEYEHQIVSSRIPYVTSVNLTAEPLNVEVILSEKFHDEQTNHVSPVYPMRSACRGILLTINNIEFIYDKEKYRQGAEYDDENLGKLFGQMGFKVVAHRNKTKRDMERIIYDFTDERHNPDLKRCDCVVVVIMSHGKDGETIFDSEILAADDDLIHKRRIKTSWVQERFNNKYCKALLGKPKILMFQICRGVEKSYPVKVDRINSDTRTNNDGHTAPPPPMEKHTFAIREFSDMLITYATMGGMQSYRDIYTGTWYIYTLCKVFMAHSHKSDVEEMLKIVDHNLSTYMSEKGEMETSTYENRSFKLCYFNPGIFLKQGKLHKYDTL